MSEGKMLKQVHIKCGNCKFIVPYKKIYRRMLISKTQRCEKCIHCDTMMKGKFLY